MNEKICEDKILYAKSINSEWQLSSELAVKSFKERFSSIQSTYNQNSLWNLFNFSFKNGSLSCFSEEFLKQINSQPSWKLALSNSKNYLVVLQDRKVEVRSSDNSFQDILVSWPLSSKDFFPQWRCITWSPDDGMIVISDSAGCVTIYDTDGTIISCIPPCQNPFMDLSLSHCAVVMKELRSYKRRGMNDDEEEEDLERLFEMMLFTYSGDLTVYAISSKGGVMLMHTHDFKNVHPAGITSAVYLPASSLLLIGAKNNGRNDDGGKVEDGTTNGWLGRTNRHGLSLWRPLSGYPYYKMVGDEEEAALSSANSLSTWLWSWGYGGGGGDHVFKMVVSPSNKQLLTLHTSHSIAIWSLPSLKLQQFYSLEDQIEKEDGLKKCDLADAVWLSEDAIVIARASGSVMVCGVSGEGGVGGGLEKLFTSPELFHVFPSLIRMNEGCFSILECERRDGKKSQHLNESTIISKSSSSPPPPSSSSSPPPSSSTLEKSIDELNNDTLNSDESYCNDEEDDDEDDGGGSWEGLWRGVVGRLVQKVMYFVTDAETFQSPKKKTRFQHRVYRMYTIKRTTPAQLYTIKLDNEEYKEALSLAEKYDLDTDLVYQRQWKKSPVTMHSIENFLTKVKKISWGLHESIDRVPSCIHATQHLLSFVLQRTSLRDLVALKEKEENSNDREKKKEWNRKEGEEKEETSCESLCEEDLIKMVDFDNLNLAQKEMCCLRHKFLNYSDRLRTYQEMLPSPSHFNNNTFSNVRSLNVVELACNYARASDHQALSKVLLHHGEQVLPYRLVILNNFPETTPPEQYSSILPSLNVDGSVKKCEVLKWRPEKDWCEVHCSFLTPANQENLVDFLYSEDPFLLKHKDGATDTMRVTEWYRDRCKHIETYSGRVDYALDLVNIAIRNKFKGLEDLRKHLKTMEILVYRRKITYNLTLDELTLMSPLQVLTLLMTKSKRETLIKDIRTWLLPYIRNKKGKNELIKEYLLSISKNDLSLLEMILKEKDTEKSEAIIEGDVLMTQVVKMCVYAYQGKDLTVIKSLINHLPPTHVKESLKHHLMGSEILHKHGIEMSLARVKSVKETENGDIQLFTRVARTCVEKDPQMSAEELKELLEDMETLRKRVFPALDQVTCYQLFVGSLLSSGRESYIQLAGNIINNNSTSTYNTTTTASTHSLRLLTSAASGIKDSLKYISPFNKPQSTIFLQGSHNSPHQPSQNIIPTLQFDPISSQKLLLKASKDYFNSSTCVTDPDMKLARMCLDLVQDAGKEVEDELKLIQGVTMLESLGLNMLPVQVRMTEKKLDVLKKILYRRISDIQQNFHKLCELGNLLNANNNIGTSEEEVRGRLLVLCCEAAIQTRDILAGKEFGKKIVAMKFVEGWRVVQRVAMEVEEYFDDKASFLQFSMTHSTDEELENILQTYSCLKAEKIYIQNASKKALLDEQQEPQTHLLPSTTHSTPLTTTHFTPSSTTIQSSLPSTKSHPQLILDQTKTAFLRTNQAMKTALVTFQNTKWWSGVWTQASDHLINLTTLSNHSPNKKSLMQYKQMDRNDPCICIHSFYQHVYKTSSTPPLLHQMPLEFKTSSPPPILSIFNNVSRGTDGVVTSDRLTEVLLSLSENTLPQDTTLALTHLLSLPWPQSAENFFDQSQDVIFMHQLALFFYSIVLANWLIQNDHPIRKQNYLSDPDLLVEDVLTCVGSMKKFSSDVESVVELFKKHYDWLRRKNERNIATEAKKTILTKPNETPKKPTETPTKPTENQKKTTKISTKPTKAALKPRETATKPTETATKPTETATKLTETATKPTETATKPTETATNQIKQSTNQTQYSTPNSSQPTAETPSSQSTLIKTSKQQQSIQQFRFHTISSDQPTPYTTQSSTPNISEMKTSFSNNKITTFSTNNTNNKQHTVSTTSPTTNTASKSKSSTTTTSSTPLLTPTSTLITKTSTFTTQPTMNFSSSNTTFSTIPSTSNTTTSKTMKPLTSDTTTTKITALTKLTTSTTTPSNMTTITPTPTTSTTPTTTSKKEPSTTPTKTTTPTTTQTENSTPTTTPTAKTPTTTPNNKINNEVVLPKAFEQESPKAVEGWEGEWEGEWGDEENEEIDVSTQITSTTTNKTNSSTTKNKTATHQTTILDKVVQQQALGDQNVKQSETKIAHEQQQLELQQPEQQQQPEKQIQKLLSQEQSIEAGETYMEWRGVHSGFRNLNSSFAFADHFRKTGK